MAYAVAAVMAHAIVAFAVGRIIVIGWCNRRLHRLVVALSFPSRQLKGFFKRMNNNFRDAAGVYGVHLHTAAARVRLGWCVVAGWIAFPILLRTLLRPGDMIWAQYALQGQHRPAFFTAQQLGAGFIETCAALAVLLAFQFFFTVLFYRSAKVAMPGQPIATPTLWPLAALLPGLIGNSAWFVSTGYFDVTGCIIGFSAIPLTVGAEIIINNLSRDFVFGPQLAGQH